MPGLFTPDAYVFAANLSRLSAPTSDDQGVFFDFTPPRTFNFFGDTIAYDEGSRRSSSPVFAEEVGSTAARVISRNFDVKFIVGPLAAIAIAVEVTLSLFVELSSRVASGGHSYD